MDRTRKKKRPIWLRLLRLVTTLVLLALALELYMIRIEPNWLQVTEVELRAPIDGTFRIVAFGDTHIGMGKTTEDVEKLVDRINELTPDAVVFLGDLYDNYSTYTGDPAADAALFSGIQAQHKYAVRGNHDVGGGAEFVFPQLIADCGFTLLENANVQLENGLNIIGAADYIYHTPNVQTLVGEGYDLLLAHEPDLADAVTDVELQLSGHSHGGQVYLPFVVDKVLPTGSKTYWRGQYEKQDGGIVYVNRGIGMSLLPLRLFSRPEITIITLMGE